MKTPLLFLVVLSALSAVGCQTATDPVVPVVNQSLSHSFLGLPLQSSDWVEGSEDAVTQTRSLKVSLTLPASANVYFLYTNIANDASVQNLAGVSGSEARVVEQGRSLASAIGDRPEPRWERASLRSLRPQTTGSRAVTAANDIPADPLEGAKATFVDSLWGDNTPPVPNDSNRHPMTLQVKQSDAGADRTLYVWVVDDCLAGSDPKAGTRFKVTRAMAQALADKFLKDASSTDIYGLVTGFLGREWPDSGMPQNPKGQTYTGLVAGNKQIHIVLGDLNPVTPDPTQEARRFGGGLQGYFHGWNNQTEVGSNERILFAIDANNLGNPDKDGRASSADPAGWTWSLLGSYYPNDIVATLAHEFQHMIHYYQKAILNGTSEADPWINEMASMAVEDLVADKVGFRGPRGFPGDDYSTGDALRPIDDGRLPQFNGTHEQIALQGWADGLDSLPHYANAYAFGAWLTRNYGGPSFWKELVQGAGTSVQAVVDTVNHHLAAGEAPQSYSSLVRNWGLAVFYGDAKPQATFVAPLVYQAAGGAEFDFGSYKTGSINLYNYEMQDTDGLTFIGTSGNPLIGPSMWNRAPRTSDILGAGATWISRIDTGTSPGSWSRTVTLPPSVVLTVVVERP